MRFSVLAKFFSTTLLDVNDLGLLGWQFRRDLCRVGSRSRSLTFASCELEVLGYQRVKESSIAPVRPWPMCK